MRDPLGGIILIAADYAMLPQLANNTFRALMQLFSIRGNKSNERRREEVKAKLELPEPETSIIVYSIIQRAYTLSTSDWLLSYSFITTSAAFKEFKILQFICIEGGMKIVVIYNCKRKRTKSTWKSVEKILRISLGNITLRSTQVHQSFTSFVVEKVVIKYLHEYVVPQHKEKLDQQRFDLANLDFMFLPC
ncbi:hypothetical protein Bhyg_14325 [Pseudolycoriella hygida]|uniref:Uncharacterized protein n=1 Tax=Pseudolycoriella hygida TaxID=35572 RepID=A0A9Q0MQE2_9DIPT|nr:hypothetical protein Bhyg_14325 [Pseudolycoriella hygida]